MPWWSYPERVHRPGLLGRRLVAAALFGALGLAAAAHALVPTAPGTRCLPATGWVADLGLRLALLHPDAGCSSGTWALTAGGLLVLAAAVATVLLVSAHGGRHAVQRLDAVRVLIAPHPVRTTTRRPAPSMAARRHGPGRHPGDARLLRGPPAA
jgi:hypothetical protein